MTPILILAGALSVYHPGDGHNAGTLACGGRFTWNQHHIAIRQWRRVGCSAKARVCLESNRGPASAQTVLERSGRRQVWKDVHQTVLRRKARATMDRRIATRVATGSRPRVVSRRCIWTEVRDSGPWGAQHPDGRWEVQIKLKPGWRRRAVVDLSHALWVALGKPKFLTKVRVEVF